jgi:hypothetical protein
MLSGAEIPCSPDRNPTMQGFALNSSDTFMLAMDHDMRRHGCTGNICHLLVTFAPGTPLDALLEQLSLKPIFTFAAQLRLCTPLLRTPYWYRIESSEPPTHTTLAVQNEEELHTWILDHQIDARREAPLGIVTIPAFYRGPSLLVFWHHSLLDAHGGERFVEALADHTPDRSYVPTTTSREPFLRFAARVKRAKAAVFSKTSGGIARLDSSSVEIPQRAYAKALFSPSETVAVDAVSTQLTGGMFSSALYVAATARAFCLVTGTTQPLFIPVPHDMRRTTHERSPLSNQLSFIFFRLSPSQLQTLEAATNSVIEQLHESIVTEAPRDQLAFLRLIRRLPSALLWKIIEIPARGHPASLYVSDVGRTLSTLTHLGGHELLFATHYPPNLSPPGLTAVWSRFRDQLELTVCYDQRGLSRDGVDRFIASIRDQLTAVPIR